nr:xylulose kinase-1 [Tanacetum cinerariifolium]
MSTPTFAKTYNLIVFLEKPTESDGFKQIIDFLNANLIKYALTVSLTIYTSCIKQFWTSAKVKTVNDDVRLQALVDGKKVIVNEASIRRDLRLDDAEGTACLPNAAIFEELARMGKHKSRRKQRKETEVSQDEPPTDKHIPTPSHDLLPSGKDRLQLNELMEICTKLSDRVLSLEQVNTNQAAKIEKLTKKVKRLEGKKKKRTHGLKRLYKGRMNDQDMFGVNDLDGDEVVIDVSARQKEEQREKIAEKEVSTAGEVVTTVDVEVSAALTTTTTTDDELTLAQTLIEIKAAKPKAHTTAATSDVEEEQRIAKQKEEKANIAMITEWDNTQAVMDADYELATKLQEEERGELSIEKKSKLFVELMTKRKNHFQMLRAEERKRKPPTKAQKRKQMCTYLKNIAEFTHNQLKSKFFKEVQQAFNKTIDWINNFVAMDSEAIKDKAVESSKRPREELEFDKSKKQKLDKNVQAEVADDDTAELKRYM